MSTFYPESYLDNLTDTDTPINALMKPGLLRDSPANKEALKFLKIGAALARDDGSKMKLIANNTIEMTDPFFDDNHSIVYLRCKFPAFNVTVAFQQYARVSSHNPIPVKHKLFSKHHPNDDNDPAYRSVLELFMLILLMMAETSGGI